MDATVCERDAATAASTAGRATTANGTAFAGGGGGVGSTQGFGTTSGLDFLQYAGLAMPVAGALVVTFSKQREDYVTYSCRLPTM